MILDRIALFLVIIGAVKLEQTDATPVDGADDGNKQC